MPFLLMVLVAVDNQRTIASDLSHSAIVPPTASPGLWDQTPSSRVGGISPLDSPPLSEDDQMAEDPRNPGSAIECGKRGMTYQPSRRKRVNSHGLEKR